MTVQQTSIFSYREEKSNGNVGKLQQTVLEVIRQYGSIDGGDVARILNKQTSTVCPRIFELREKGLVKEDCRKVNKTTHKTTIHWKIA